MMERQRGGCCLRLGKLGRSRLGAVLLPVQAARKGSACSLLCFTMQFFFLPVFVLLTPCHYALSTTIT